MFGITLFKSDDKVFIHCNKEGTIIASENPEEAVREIEQTYNGMHHRGYESSMSACIHYIFFQPRIVTVEDLDEIKSHIAADPPRLVSLGHVSGFAYGITCRPEAMAYWEKAANPQLISEPERNYSI